MVDGQQHGALLMAYFHEETVKMSLVCTIQQLADSLGIPSEFGPLHTLSYAQLAETRDVLLAEYNFQIAHKKES